jgi:hypothetical protein
MKCLSKIINRNTGIKVGDILIFSNSKAFLILSGYIHYDYMAVQIFNNGNEELGNITYCDDDINDLEEQLTGDFGKYIVKNMRDVSITF